jgi:hypothetical protein
MSCQQPMEREVCWFMPGRPLKPCTMLGCPESTPLLSTKKQGYQDKGPSRDLSSWAVVEQSSSRNLLVSRLPRFFVFVFDRLSGPSLERCEHAARHVFTELEHCGFIFKNFPAARSLTLGSLISRLASGFAPDRTVFVQQRFFLGSMMSWLLQ